MTKHQYYDPLKFNRELGQGIDRTAYYSVEYNLVMKRSHYYYNDKQSANEKKVWDAMTKEERKIFPVVKFFKDKGNWCIIMPRIITFESRGFMFQDKTIKSIVRFKRYCAAVGANTDNLELILRVQQKFHLGDLHCGNIGWLENGDLVIVDMGL